MAKQEPDPNHPYNQDTTDERTRRRAWSILRLLRSDSPEAVHDPELKQEFDHLYHLLQRIEELAEQELGVSAPPAEREQSAPDHTDEPEPEPEWRRDTAPGTGADPEIDPDLVAFDPFVFDESIPETPAQPADGESGDEHPAFADAAQQFGNEEPAQPDPGPTAQSGDENVARWWVNFNGDISLERLARLRKTLSESPFTIEARFDEITDGLIVLRVVTEGYLTLEQVEWIVRQVMQGVGLDRNAAIISRN